MELQYTWQILGTTAGATAAVLLIVQFVKAPLDKVWKIPTRLLVYILSALIVIGARFFGAGEVNWDTALLLVVNAFVVAMAAMGSYEVTFAKLEQADAKPPGGGE